MRGGLETLYTYQLLTCREQSRGDPTLAANTYTSPTSDPGPSVDNLTKNIYSQVGSLISAQVFFLLFALSRDGTPGNFQARTPASLARLLHSLTLLGNQDLGRLQDLRVRANANAQVDRHRERKSFDYLPRKPWRHRASPLKTNHEVLAAAGQQQGLSRAPRGCRQRYRC